MDDALGYTSNDRPVMEYAESNAATKALQPSTMTTTTAAATAYSDFAAAAERTYETRICSVLFVVDLFALMRVSSIPFYVCLSLGASL